MPHDPVATDHVAQDVAEVPFEDLAAAPGVVEAIELYESSMKAYVTASTSYATTTTLSSSSLTEAL